VWLPMKPAAPVTRTVFAMGYKNGLTWIGTRAFLRL
jgi:hypothetical protein